MTPAVTLLVMVTGHLLIRQSLSLPAYLDLRWKVLHRLTRCHDGAIPCDATGRYSNRNSNDHRSAASGTEAAFRRRLSAKRRTARLLADEAHDHYLRVHTDSGTELVTMRFADAFVELKQAHGYRVHRSGWFTAGAIENVRWRRGSGEMRLTGDLIAPVSRTYKDVLIAAAWL